VHRRPFLKGWNLGQARKEGRRGVIGHGPACLGHQLIIGAHREDVGSAQQPKCQNLSSRGMTGNGQSSFRSWVGAWVRHVQHKPPGKKRTGVRRPGRPRPPACAPKRGYVVGKATQRQLLTTHCPTTLLLATPTPRLIQDEAAAAVSHELRWQLPTATRGGDRRRQPHKRRSPSSDTRGGCRRRQPYQAAVAVGSRTRRRSAPP